MVKAGFFGDYLSGHRGMADTEDLLAVPPCGAHPHGQTGGVEECADPVEADWQDAREIPEKPALDEAKCQENPAGERDDGHDQNDGHDEEYTDENADFSYESAPFEGDPE